MKNYNVKILVIFIYLISSYISHVTGQSVIKGVISDVKTGEAIIGATVLIQGTNQGTATDWDGSFLIKTSQALPVNLEIRYSGYANKIVSYNESNKNIKISIEEEAVEIAVVEVKGQRISDKQKSSPLTVESMDLLAIKETPAANFYDGLGSLKDVDLTAASLGFKVVNTRGFNSTSPVRSLQLIDGVDNQAPGLNFSLGNFLGSSELDVLKVDLVVGASSAFYGPNAFNGVINMETKSPFYHKGLSAQIKTGERALLDGAVRYANAFKNKKGFDNFGYKINFSFLKANDWVADNYRPVDGTKQDSNYSIFNIPNPGRWDAVNIYGDEYYSLSDLTKSNTLTGDETAFWADPGLRIFHRTGYKEIDLVDYNTKNYKANAAFHFKLCPEKTFQSPELILSSSFGSGTTVYQGDNRFSLKNILFFQNRIEIRKEDKYFVRAYATHEDAGDSYDPYFTALKILEVQKIDELWAQHYRSYWKTIGKFQDRMKELGYPQIVLDPITFEASFDFAKARQWLRDNADSLTVWHRRAEDFANLKQDDPKQITSNYFAPGTYAFDTIFQRITSSKSNASEGGTRFFDKSALYHIQGEYKFKPSWLEYWTVGANARLYRPYSDGTIFKDGVGQDRISNFEYGIYSGLSKKFFDNKWTGTLTCRLDKNQNFNFISTPAASLVYKPKENTYWRVSFSSAIRNPTLTDQYLNLNVGRAILSGNLDGVKNLITVESFIKYLGDKKDNLIKRFDIGPVKPERVQTFETGFRTTLFSRVYADLGYYYSIYNDFIGYNIGIKVDSFDLLGLPRGVQAYRYSANSINTVKTQGFSIGLNYYFAKYYGVNGNFSWNKLIKTVDDDPIIPAFNTPEFKYNIGFSARELQMIVGGRRIQNIGFNINYKWVQGFTFEGSPQFSGYLPAYGLMDAQINYKWRRPNLTFKLGASNLLDNKHYETYGGPLIGRLAYFSLLYDWKKN